MKICVQPVSNSYSNYVFIKVLDKSLFEPCNESNKFDIPSIFGNLVPNSKSALWSKHLRLNAVMSPVPDWSIKQMRAKQKEVNQGHGLHQGLQPCAISLMCATGNRTAKWGTTTEWQEWQFTVAWWNAGAAWPGWQSRDFKHSQR